MLQKNPVMQWLKKLTKTQRGLIIAGAMTIVMCLMLIGRFHGYSKLFPPSWYWLLSFLAVAWLCSNVIAYSVISFKTSWKDTVHNLLGWVWTFLVTAASILFFFRALTFSSPAEGRPNLTMYSSPNDKSCTLYFYEVGGSFWEGQDIDVTLEMADDVGNETFVCHLEGVHDLGLIWKSNTSFAINGQVYVIENGRASPIEKGT